MVPDLTIAASAPTAGTGVRIVLEPLSHPELAPIRINDSLFAIGRTETPFDAYPPELASELSRRHARIFCEQDAVYIADLGSTNGTSVNGVAVRTSIATLRSGDVLGLGKTLKFRVCLEHGPAPAPRKRLASLSLTPKQESAALQAIVVTEFPFLVSKAEDSFARYRESEPAQVNYLSRRHAHIFLKGGEPYLEDLGSTNGSFVNGRRIEEQAVPLHDGDTLAFGGRYFVYRVGLRWDEAPLDAAPTRVGVTQVPAAADAERTTFVAAADSFLDIFCAEPPPAQEDKAAAPDAGADAPAPHRARVRPAWAIAAVALLVLLGWALLRGGGAEREAGRFLASGKYVQAAAVTAAALAHDPDNAGLRVLDTEAQLKAGLPPWIAALDKGQFQRAAAQVDAMRSQDSRNPELAPLLTELDWIGQLRAFAAARGGAQAPVRDDADAARIRQFLRQWEEQGDAHQRAFMIMSAHVPAYRDAYAAALSDIRKLALQEANREVPSHEAAHPEAAIPEAETHGAAKPGAGGP